MIDNTSLTIFRAIVEFVSAINESFGKNHKPLRMYNRLIDQTTIKHEGPIKKHIEAFREFCVNNREAITEKKYGKILYPRISYSEHVYINMETIFKHADRETTEVIWSHILTISAMVDPTGRAKKVLQESKANNSSAANETNFLANIINKVEENVDINANPAQAMSSILSSGIFNDVIQGMGAGLQDGTLDLGKLMGSVNSLVAGLDTEGLDPETQQMKSTINNMTSVMATLNTEDANPAAITSLLAPMMGNMVNGVNIPSGGPSIKLEEGKTKEDSLKDALEAEYQKSKQESIKYN